MKYSTFFLVFLVLCSLHETLQSTTRATVNEVSAPDTFDVPRLEGRIVNGTKAITGQFPHQVSLRRSYSDSHFCGGSVISNHWILTAAHCMFKNNGGKLSPWSITVTGGHVSLNDTRGQRRAVEAIIVHPSFEPMTLTNDVALLKLKLPFDLTTMHLRAAVLASQMPQSGTVCKVSGWGYLAEDKKVVSNDLMYVALPLISPTRCRQLLVNVTHLPLGMFCAGFEEGLKDACQGDSGGGMICAHILVGVVSGGEGCARPALPGLYADVPYYRNWIEYQMKNFNGTVNSDITTGGYVPEHVTNNGRNNSPTVNLSLPLFFFVMACLAPRLVSLAM